MTLFFCLCFSPKINWQPVQGVPHVLGNPCKMYFQTPQPGTGQAVYKWIILQTTIHNLLNYEKL